MKNPTLAEWVAAYIEIQESGNITEKHPLFWAIDKFFELNDSDRKLVGAQYAQYLTQLAQIKFLQSLPLAP